MTADTARQEIVKYCQRLYERQFVAANDGNVSVLLDDGAVLITPSMMSKGEITEDMLITIDFEGRIVGGGLGGNLNGNQDGSLDGGLSGGLKPSSEVRMHIECYRRRSDIQAVMHAHPPFATAFSATEYADTVSDEILLPEILITTGRIGIVPYLTPGSVGLSLGTAEAIADHNGVLLRNHGVLTVGKNVREAYFRLECIEQYCKVRLLASMLGKPSFLSEDEVGGILNSGANPNSWL